MLANSTLPRTGSCHHLSCPAVPEFLFFLKKIYLFNLFIGLCQFLVVARGIFVAACGIFVAACGIFVAACGLFICSMWDLSSLTRDRTGPPALGVQSLSLWTTREVPVPGFFFSFFLVYFWLHWVFVAAHGLSLVAVSGGYSSLWCACFLLGWLLMLRSTGSRAQAQ